MTKTQIKAITEIAAVLERAAKQPQYGFKPDMNVIFQEVKKLRNLTLPPTPESKAGVPEDSRKISSDYARRCLAEHYHATGGNVANGLLYVKTRGDIKLAEGAVLMYRGGKFYLQGSPEILCHY